MNKQVKILIQMIAAAFSTVVLLGVMSHILDWRDKSIRRKGFNKRFLVIEDQLHKLRIFADDKKNQMIDEFALYLCSDRYENPEHVVYLYYKVIETVEAVAEIGLLEYYHKDQIHRLLYARDCPSSFIVVQETPEYMYVVPPEDIERLGRIQQLTMAVYLLGQEWRNGKYEINSKQADVTSWAVPSPSIKYYFRSLDEYYWEIIESDFDAEY